MGESQAFQSRPPESQTSPWLVFFHGRNKRSLKKSQAFFSSSEKKFYGRSIPEMSKYRYWPTPQGWMLIQERSSQKWYLLELTTMKKISLPPLDCKIPFYYNCMLSSSPVAPNCMVMCAGSEGNCIFFCDLKENKWIKHDIEGANLSPIVACNGNFYGLSLQRLVIIEFSPEPRIRHLEKVDIHEPVGLYAFESFLVESCGELFYIQAFIHRGFRRRRVHYDVSKRDFTHQTWNIVNSIGDRVFFLGLKNFAASWSASELGVKANCIYFIVGNDKCLYMFDMEDGSISVHETCPNVCSKRCAPFWIMPSTFNDPSSSVSEIREG